MQDAFINELSALYNTEKELLQGMPDMAKAVSSPEAKQVMQQHHEETQQQLQRLEQIFQQMGQSPNNIIPEGIKGIMKENEKIQQHGYEAAVLDAELIAAAQRAEHYEIAGYGAAVAHAKGMGNTQVADLLAQTLQEEKQADEKLAQVAKSVVNPQAIKS